MHCHGKNNKNEHRNIYPHIDRVAAGILPVHDGKTGPLQFKLKTIF
jgi:hypothetical protein